MTPCRKTLVLAAVAVVLAAFAKGLTAFGLGFPTMAGILMSIVIGLLIPVIASPALSSRPALGAPGARR